MIKWIMMSLSAILFFKMSIFLISTKLFNKFANLFGEKTKINLKMNKLSYFIIGYVTSIYVFVRGLRLNGKEPIDAYTIYVFIFILVMVVPLNIILTKIQNKNLKFFVSILAGLLLALGLFWAALLTSI
ncbi:hypothetical protein [Acetoanaerobium sticklandii]|uniref:hypothetical protein n=1 Tax=Acetoanaerobium sticklandii TaxID=1511 RepID=UPI003A8DDF58